MTAGLLTLWSHLLAAALYGALAVWQLRHWQGDPRGRPLVTAFAVLSVWAIFMALLGPWHLFSQLADAGRTLAFLAFMYGIAFANEDERRRPSGVKALYGAVAGAVGLQIALGGAMSEFREAPILFSALAATLDLIGLIVAAGCLVLVHNLYGQAAEEGRSAIRLPAIALAAMWVYDLHLHTVAWLTRGPAEDLFAMRGAILAMLVPLFALALRRTSDWRVRLSRAATFQSVSLLVILVYLLAMMAGTRAVEIVGGEWARAGQIGLVFLMTLAAVIVLPSARARAWLRVVTAKHLFEHRYDYRSEWLRFTHTIGGNGAGAEPIEERLVRALAEICGAGGGLLLVPDGAGRLRVVARWSWRHADPEPGEGDDASFLAFLAAHGHILDPAAAARNPCVRHGGAAAEVPAWLRSAPAWAGVPLVHGGRLAGLLLLDHPEPRRPLDWEDFDLFRAAGMQAASYLAEARSHQALAEARRFDEFNRRFAFIMHDIKNLVSQLSLVARNAERHADNPDFRADMIATLQSSVKKMNDLLARLSGGAREAAAPRIVPARAVAAAVAEARRRHHPIEVTGDPALAVRADPARLEQALGHLVQNAIEASAPDAPVRLAIGEHGGEVRIDVIDSGAGMSADFLATRLFAPFDTTKPSGFGIGAYEARALVRAMGGRLDVESTPGTGSRFTLFLPRAHNFPAACDERKRA
jgi:putative PEP-CTERM system histidine kinase